MTAVCQSAKVIGQNQALPVLNKTCQAILLQPHLFIIEHSYLRIYKEFSAVCIKLFKSLAGFFANSHFLFPITNQANYAEKKAVGVVTYCHAVRPCCATN